MSTKIRIFDENGEEQSFSKFSMKEELKGHGNPADLIHWAMDRMGLFRNGDASFEESECRSLCEAIEYTKEKMDGYAKQRKSAV